MSVNPSRLTLARQRRGMSATALGALVDVTPRTISRWEDGDVDPLPTSIHALAKALDVPESFLAAADLDAIPVDAVSFRALSKMTARQRDAATAAGAIASEVGRWIEARFTVPKPNLPTLEGYDPERAAAVVRERWGLGQAPIGNLLHTLEANGVRVFSLAPDISVVDAFSFTTDGIPYIILNTQKTGERRRFDAAHELGHLVLHCGDEVPHGKESEREAQAFAAALLMPRTTVLAAGLRNAGVDRIMHEKRRWKVAAMALAHRLNELELVTDWGYRDVCVRLTQLGYRRGEPNGAIIPETSQVLAKVFKSLRSQGISPADLAEQLHLTHDELNRCVFGLVPLLVSGGSQGGVVPAQIEPFRVIEGGSPKPTGRGAPTLRGS